MEKNLLADAARLDAPNILSEVDDERSRWENSEASLFLQEMSVHNLPDLFMQIPAPMGLLDGGEAIFRAANPALIELIGHDPVGQTLDEVFAVHQPGGGREFTILRPELQKTFYVNISLHPYRDSKGQEFATLVFCQDVTNQVLAKETVRESETYFRSLAETLPQIVWSARPNGEITYMNERWKEFSDSFEPNWLKLTHPEDRKRAKESWAISLQSGQPMELDLRFRSKDGNFRWFLLRAVAAKDAQGNVKTWYGSATDIEERKLQSKELADAKREAERANATKSAFLANMSHEIRTPLGAILGFTELLRDPKIPTEEKDSFLEIISRNGKALTRVIDDILDLSKVEAGHLTIEKSPFHLEHVLGEITSLFSESIKAKELYMTLLIDPSVPSVVLSDPARLRQILINIIGNAVKFTSEGGIRIQVSSVPLSHSESRIVIAVTDTGPGLMRSQQKKLFQPFTQADNTTTRKYGGTGLGLALSRRLAQAMGGNIRISACKIRQGCTFQITIGVGLPSEEMVREISQDIARSKAGSRGGVLQNAKVLLVEDAFDNQVLIKRILSKNGAEVELASNGLEGLEKAQERKGMYTIILMDIQMPVMDGYEAIRRLRASGYKGPVFALTAHAMAEERRKTQAAGYDGHLTKPLDTEVLIETVRRFCPSL